MTTKSNRARGFAFALLTTVSLAALGGTAHAQLNARQGAGGDNCPSGITSNGGCVATSNATGDHQAPASPAAPAAGGGTPAASSDTTDGDDDFVALAERVPDCTQEDMRQHRFCATPRAARPSTIARDTPTVGRRAFYSHYPQMGARGFDFIREENRHLCTTAEEFLKGIDSLDKLFLKGDHEEQLIYEVYAALPEKIRKVVRIVEVTQVVQTGFLCAISFGTYCLAVAIGGAGNIAMTELNKSLMLANVRLSVANILLTRWNIWSNRLTLRLDAIWIGDYYPHCEAMGFTMHIDLPKLEAPPTAPEDFGVR